MGELGERVGVAQALAFSVLVSMVCALAVLLAWERSLAGFADAAQQPKWLWIGGLMSVLGLALLAAGSALILRT